eukprot:760864-Hanusia_phi.AAC.1
MMRTWGLDKRPESSSAPSKYLTVSVPVTDPRSRGISFVITSLFNSRPLPPWTTGATLDRSKGIQGPRDATRTLSMTEKNFNNRFTVTTEFGYLASCALRGQQFLLQDT